MGDSIKKNDFIEIDYTGRSNKIVFDTTEDKVAKENGIHGGKKDFKPAIICVGEQQVINGLDKQLVGKEIGKSYSITLKPEEAFGKRDIKNIKIVPMSTFKEHKVQPQPGLQIDVDGRMGIVSKVSGGRVIVNFNHPLSGKEVIYEFKAYKKITDPKAKISAFLNTSLRFPVDQIKIEIKEEKANITMPIEFPPQVIDALSKKLNELTNLKEVKFTVKKEK